MSLTKFVKEEALKDAALMREGAIDIVKWHFYKSAIISKMEPSKPLKEFLEILGIKVVISK